jgi:hypothetical protein
MPGPRITFRHLVWGAAALGFVACATSSATGGSDDAGTIQPVGEAGADVAAGNDAQPLVPDDTGAPQDDTGTEADGAGDTGPSDAALDLNQPDTFDAGFCATTPPSNLCGLTPQCGCGAGTCDIDRNVTTGATVCATAGATPRGQRCTTTAQCAQGNTCESGACRPFCAAVAAACNQAGTGKCVQAYTASIAVPNFKVCEIDCALQDPNACGGSGEGCIYDDLAGGTDCFPVGTATTCSSASTDCAPGRVCVSTGGGTSYGCFRWCRVGSSGATDCAGTGTCTGFGTPVLVKGAEYGACL